MAACPVSFGKLCIDGLQDGVRQQVEWHASLGIEQVVVVKVLVRLPTCPNLVNRRCPDYMLHGLRRSYHDNKISGPLPSWMGRLRELVWWSVLAMTAVFQKYSTQCCVRVGVGTITITRGLSRRN
jgi:hypothetical protein